MLNFASITQTGGTLWRYTWAATTGPYRIYLRGELLDTITDTEYEYEEATATHVAPPIEVLDAGYVIDPNSVAYPARVRLQWRVASGADLYEIQKYSGGSWGAVDVVDEQGLGYYTWVSDALADVTIHRWRVVPINDDGLEGSPLGLSALVVRNPEQDQVAYSYSNATGNVTVEAV